MGQKWSEQCYEWTVQKLQLRKVMQKTINGFAISHYNSEFQRIPTVSEVGTRKWRLAQVAVINAKA